MSSSSVRITSLKLKNYRNHNNVVIKPLRDIIVIYGKNGSGKTNILESISLIETHNGFRNANLSELIPDSLQDPLELFGVNLQIESISSEWTVGLGLKKQQNILKRITYLDKSKVDFSDLKNYLSIFWIVPKMSHLFQNSSEERRNFLDMMINSVNKSHSKNLQTYQKLKKERIKILKNGKTKNYDHWLDLIEEKMSHSGLILCDTRRTFLKSLNQNLKVINDSISSFLLGLNGILDNLLSEKPALFVEDFFKNELKKNRLRDAVTGRTTFSANKTDLVVFDKFTKKEARSFSTGEQKLIMISIILSFIEFLKISKITKIIFLLDDIFSYLDTNYISILIKELSKLKVQTWITDVRADWVENFPYLEKLIHKINIGHKDFKVPDIKI